MSTEAAVAAETVPQIASDIAAPRPSGQRPGQRPGPQSGKAGFQNGRPPRRRIASVKAAVMSPEARRLAEETNQKMIQEWLSRRQATQCEPRWALGAVPSSLFGTEV